MTATYPGVDVEENANAALSVVPEPTAVPVFAAAEMHALFDGPYRIHSWQDFTSLNIAQDSLLYCCIKLYFLNGGQYCYILHPSKMVEIIPELDDVTLLVAAGENIQAAVEALCVSGQTRFAILDAPNVPLVDGQADLGVCGTSEYSALYYPWLRAQWAKVGADYLDIAPSAAIAGMICASDQARGVWKAPANVALKGDVRPTFAVSEAAMTSSLRCNMIREFPGRGTLVWGARTLTTADDATACRYVPVRRLISSIERDVKKTLNAVVFDPNNSDTWQRVRTAVDNYLRQLWRCGALLGNAENEAYFVQIGAPVTMSDDDIGEGKLILKVGVAAIHPAEFIALEWCQQVAQG